MLAAADTDAALQGSPGQRHTPGLPRPPRRLHILRLPERPTHLNQMKDITIMERNPILITGAGGQVGGVSRVMVDMLLEQGHPVRAFVRRDDERAQSLREVGAEVFVGDLLNVADVAPPWRAADASPSA